jgi:hypothetical protein
MSVKSVAAKTDKKKFIKNASVGKQSYCRSKAVFLKGLIKEAKDPIRCRPSFDQINTFEDFASHVPIRGL